MTGKNLRGNNMTNKPNLLGGKIILRHIERAIELEEREHLEKLQLISDTAESRGVEISRSAAEVEKMRATNELIRVAVHSQDPFKALLAIKAMSPEADAQVDSVMDELFKGKIEKEKAEIAKLWAEAKNAQADADLKRSNVEIQIRENADSK